MNEETLTEGVASTETFDAYERLLQTEGAAAVVDRLVDDLRSRKAYRPLLDALLLKARFDLALPAIPGKTTADWPEAKRLAYEERYVEAIRTVGEMLLEAGRIAEAWPYFRAIAEPETVAKAIDAFEPETGDERLHEVVEAAFNQGANPKKGYELILKHYGTCSAVTAFENLPRDDSVRDACADMLVRQVHEHLVRNLKSEIAGRGEVVPDSENSLPNLMNGRDWLFDDEAYHVDVSHLAATVRVGPLLKSNESIAVALELANYGKHLSPRHSYEGDAPFEKVYEDHAAYFEAVLGRDPDNGIARFRTKLSRNDLEASPQEEYSTDDLVTAQVLVALLARIGRPEEALEIASTYLAGVPDSSLFCPRNRPTRPGSRPARSFGRGRPPRKRPGAVRHGDLEKLLIRRLDRFETSPS